MAFNFWRSAVITALLAAFFAGVTYFPGATSRADEKPSKTLASIDAAKIDAARREAIEFLRITQLEDGAWTQETAPGVSGLITWALLRGGVSPRDPMLEKALKHLATFVQEDGGVYFVKSDHRNYETSICLLA